MERLALGIIETLGYIAAVEALDISLKSANVKLVNRNFVTGGLINITISGDVGAVKAAIDSVTGSMQNTSNLISTHVIPRPIDSVWNMIEKSSENSKSAAKDSKDEAEIEKEKISNNDSKDSTNNSNEEKNKENDLTKEQKDLDKEESLDKEETNELTDEDEKKN